jgi:DNA-binding NarL/FixJ family response regulator
MLVDDHRLFRQGLRALIDACGRMEVLDEAGDGREAVRLAGATRAAVVVMDMTMPVMNGVEATRLIKAERPDLRVVALSGHAERRMAVEMFRAGASGYALKEKPFEDLVEAIDAALSGRLYCDGTLMAGIISDYVALLSKDDGSPVHQLSSRELEVLQLLSEGKTSKEIAFELDVGVKTVETHRQSVMEKLDIHSVAGLTKFALREGLTPE